MNLRYHLRLLNEQSAPVSCCSDDGPMEQALLRAKRYLREEGARCSGVEICDVVFGGAGTYTGSRVALVTREAS